MTDGDSCPVKWQGALDISRAGEIRNELRALLEDGKKIQLDAERVQRADTAVLQLLCAFIRDARAHAVEVEWVATSPALLTAVGLLGLEGELGLSLDDGAAVGA